ncbi:DUF3108 domain-containing protein [Hymenobacter busanensis]|uniref:DUF3108 domain-containing protein n=1 Tax=Hymenobacter busanensis TaxID=2607656 RepID=A0A7L5A1B3_9BACT|nr:DUF3108 domain-containing protein [Hymenobacter busanensis]KAA9338578.1 DUF3108 domain-containing protein [Hymenobacter busanensis]QHJ08993.1 DUF3108 domain-containing protein [Hymenobacter busanensis]
MFPFLTPRRWLFLPLALLFLAVLGLTAYSPNDTVPRAVRNESFKRGEEIRYKVHYGLITAAEAVIEVSDDLHRINDRPCYKATVTGRTNGSFDLFLKVRDTWRSYIDTTSMLPQRFFRNIEENNYRKKETVDFDHTRDMVDVESKKKDKEVKRSTFKVPDNVQDLVSGFYFLRTVDFSNRKVGDQVNVKGFFDNEVFDMTVTYKGRQNVETKAGTIRAIRLTPKMPKNKLFRGEDAISVYFSDDRNKIPVLFEAEMFVGSVKVDMYKYSGLKNRLALVKE